MINKIPYTKAHLSDHQKRAGQKIGACAVTGCLRKASSGFDSICFQHRSRVPKALRDKLSKARKEKNKELYESLLIELNIHFKGHP